MNILIVYLGSFYVLTGIIFLFVPIIYLELGRPKDLIKAFLNLLIGFLLILKNKTFDESFFAILLLITVMFIMYLVELVSSRLNQLTDKEKNKLTTFLEFKKNISKTFEAINLGISNFTKPFNFLDFNRNNKKLSSKKWVRNDKNDNIKT